MTVQELIAELEKVKDKTKVVGIDEHGFCKISEVIEWSDNTVMIY